MVGRIAQAGDITWAGSHYHDHNTDGIGSFITSIIEPTMTVSIVISSTMTMASVSKLAIIIALMIASMWVVVLTTITLVVIALTIVTLVLTLIWILVTSHCGSNYWYLHKCPVPLVSVLEGGLAFAVAVCLSLFLYF